MRIKPLSVPGKITRKIIGSGVSGIRIKYWKEFSPFHTRYFLIDLEKHDDVHIMIGYLKVNEEWFFHSFTYGMVVSDA